MDTGLVGADVSCTLVVVAVASNSFVIISASVIVSNDKVVSFSSFPVNFVITGENGPMSVEFSIDEDDEVVSSNTEVVEDTNDVVEVVSVVDIVAVVDVVSVVVGVPVVAGVTVEDDVSVLVVVVVDVTAVVVASVERVEVAVVGVVVVVVVDISATDLVVSSVERVEVVSIVVVVVVNPVEFEDVDVANKIVVVKVVTAVRASIAGFGASWTSLTTRLCVKDSGLERKGAV